MKNKLIAYKERMLEKRRIFGYLGMLISLVLVFLYFLPLFCTFVQGVKESILGYFSFSFINDSFDIIHYSISVMIIGIILSIVSFIISLVLLFIHEDHLNKTRHILLGTITLKTIADIVTIIIASQTRTNIQLDWGGYLLPVIDVFALILLLYFNLHRSDSKESLFAKQDKEVKED